MGYHKSTAQRGLLAVRVRVQAALEALRSDEVDLEVACSELECAEKGLRSVEVALSAAIVKPDRHVFDVAEHLEKGRGLELDTSKWLLDTFTETDVSVANQNYEIQDSGGRFTMHRMRSLVEQSQDVQKAMTVPPVAKLLNKCRDWDFDALALPDALADSEDRPICVFGAHIVQYRGSLIKAMKTRQWISDQESFSQTFVAFLAKMDQLYRPEVTYHNASHAVDVMATTDMFMRSSYVQEVTTPLDHFMAVAAAAIHDVGHPGRNALFQTKTMSPLAIRYNDTSILESMHASLAFQTMRQNSECDWLALLAQEDDAHQLANLQQYVRKGIISMVLGTDMVKHQKYVDKLASMAAEARDDDADEACEFRSSDGPTKKQQNLEQKFFILEAMLHAADLSNPCKPREIALAWSRRVCEEFWAQGDEERSLGLQISPMCDRLTGVKTVPKSQLGFINFVIRPLFNPLVQLVEEIEIATEELAKNVVFWEERDAEGATFEQIFGQSPMA